MRPPALAVLVCLAVASLAHAGPRACGNDADGRGTVVPCRCGDVLVSSRTLTDDDPVTQGPCDATGLVVQITRDGDAVLDLAGHTLQGTGHGFGLQILRGGSTGLRLKGPGAVRGFGTGVQSGRGGLASATNVLAAENVRDGFEVAGFGYTISGCEAVRNGGTGFVLRGRDYHADGNRALENGRVGVAASGRNASLGADTGNEASGNGRDGVRVRGRNSTVEGLTVIGNARRGLRAHVARGRIARTTASGNRAQGVAADGPGLTVDDAAAGDNGKPGRCGRGRECR